MSISHSLLSISHSFLSKKLETSHLTIHPTLVYVWVYFNIIPNTVLLPILIATFLISKKASRHPTLINACMTWVFSGIFASLLFYAGQQFGPNPDPALCIAQASLLYGIMPMWSVAVLVLVCHMLDSMSSESSKRDSGRIKLFIMLALPYIAQLMFSVAALVIALQHPGKVSRSRRILFCSLKSPPLSNTVSIFTFSVCIGITIIEAQIAFKLYRNWRGIRSAGFSGGAQPQFLLRVLAFGLYVFCGMIVNLVSMLAPSSIFPEMYAATAGTVLFLIFGTQADVLRAWGFWRKATPKPAPSDSSQPDGDGTRHDPDVKEVADEEKGMEEPSTQR